MTRIQQSVVVYPADMALPAASPEKFEQFEKWLAGRLAQLESRWIGVSPAPRATRPASPSPERA